MGSRIEEWPDFMMLGPQPGSSSGQISLFLLADNPEGGI
jgi:hypothetical protein